MPGAWAAGVLVLSFSSDGRDRKSDPDNLEETQ